MNRGDHNPRAAAGWLGVLLSPARLAHAHSGANSYAYVVLGDDTVTGNVQFTISDLTEVLGLAIPQDEAGARLVIDGQLDAIVAYATEHFSIRNGGTPWALDFTGYRVLERQAGSYAILEYRVADLPDPIPRRFTVSFDGIIHAMPHHESLVIVKTSSGFGSLRTESDQRISCAAGNTEHDVVIADKTLMSDARGATSHVVAGAKEYIRRARKRLRN